VRTNQAMRSAANFVDKPERIGPALAQVVHTDDYGHEVILGQAWLAAPNRLVTCGHVVEQFAHNTQGLFVFFPATGNRYAVLQAQLHPSFVRQPDGLVKFDVAVLNVQLAAPDSLAIPLPFTYENSLQTNQALWTIRYPVHLGQLSAAVQPLSQDGRFLGLLRKHDSFHLLHDVPLAPGDSGAPICDGQSVVAVHCGDTATLPGLNLATTSIRLALWIDALRELNLIETRKTSLKRASRLIWAVVSFITLFAITIGSGTLLFSKPQVRPAALDELSMLPFTIKFNKAPDQYAVGEAIEIVLSPKTPSYPFLFLVNKSAIVAEIFPAAGKIQKLTKSTTIDQGHEAGSDRPEQLEADAEPMKLYVVNVKADNPDSSNWARALVKPSELDPRNKIIMTFTEQELLNRIAKFEKEHPDLITLTKIDLPAAK